MPEATDMIPQCDCNRSKALTYISSISFKKKKKGVNVYDLRLGKGLF